MKYHVFGTLSSGLNFNTFSVGVFWRSFFCCADSSCVYDHNHPYLVSERDFLCREQAFSVPAESRGAPAESRGYTLRCCGDLTCGYFRGCRT